MSDLNYNIAPVNPMQGYMSALQTGAMIGGLRDEREKARAQAEADRLAAQQKAEKDAQLAEAYNIVKQAPTYENYAALANLLPPELAKSARENITMLEEAKQAALLSDSANVFAAFSSNQPELGIKILEERAAAYRNEGNENGVKETQRFIDLANSGEMGQQAVKDIFGTVISMMPKGKDAIDAVAKFHEDRRAEEMHPLNMAKLRAELEEKEKNGGITKEERFTQEEKLRKEYYSRVANYTAMLGTNANIIASAQDKSGAGDLALVTSFMKMLDPGSVVRESEFASAQDTAGLFSKLASMKQKVQDGQFLTESQRKDFAELAGKYMDAATENEKKVRKNLGVIVKNYGLNEENVFGLPEETSPAPAQAGAAGAPVSKPSAPKEIIKRGGDL
jgi:hypothetical protein